MRLARIEALRFGLLQNACLTGLGDGLTVVLGPNESGKTTFGAVTRQVLYGYADKRTTERGYAPTTGPRAARLVFRDDAGEWLIERVDGARGGPVTITGPGGQLRSGLLDEIVSGVNKDSFSVVFGFGLDELNQIEKGGKADIVARLYAAGTGLAVNPLDVKKAIEERAEELYAAKKSKPLVNRLAREQRDLRDQIKLLEDTAASLADDQQRLRSLADDLAEARSKRDALDERVRVLDQDATRLADATAVLDQANSEADELARTIAELERSAGYLDVDERVLVAGPAIDAVLADASGYRARLEALNAAQAQADEADRQVIALGTLPAHAIDGVESRTGVEERAARLTQLSAVAQAEEAGARTAEAQAAATHDVAAQAVPQTSKTPAPTVVVGALALVLLAAVAAAVISFAQGLTQIGILSVLTALAAGVALGATLMGRPSAPPMAAPLTERAASLKADAQARRAVANAAAADLATAQGEWQAWLAARGLDAHGTEPAAVRILLGQLQERARLLADSARFQAAATREHEAAQAWLSRLADVVRSYDPSALQMPSFDEAGGLAERARRDLERARQASAELARITAQLDAARRAQASMADRLEDACKLTAQITARHQLSPEAPLPSMGALAQRTRDELLEAREITEQFAREHAGLQSRLDQEGRTDAMALARQQLEGLRAQAAQAADLYLVDALAVRLLDRARERYERERQPEVVQTAERVFSAMTAGRYTALTVPLDNSGVTVTASDGTRRTSDQLSRGTAEQLYLALRVGLIGSLGELGRMLPVLMDDVVVNFDPERRAGAVAAVAELAKLRQVIYFTCHPDTAALLAEQVPGATLIGLDRCSL